MPPWLHSLRKSFQSQEVPPHPQQVVRARIPSVQRADPSWGPRALLAPGRLAFARTRGRESGNARRPLYREAVGGWEGCSKSSSKFSYMSFPNCTS